jgi:serine/threonine protein phosphatase PrpC
MAENFFGSTDTGKIRDNNEDAFIATTLSNGWIAACVIDGVGGYEGGEVAAGIAKDAILKHLSLTNADVTSSLKESIRLANKNIYNEKLSGKGNSQMACVLTLALVDVTNNLFYYAHVGDTRMYLLRDESLVKVTKDHSFVGFLEDSGRLSEKEAMEHPKRNEINKALGFDSQMETDEEYIETGSSPFLPGDMLMLCSDGLTDLVNNKEMSSILLSSLPLSQRAAALIEAANNAGGKDNITVVLVHNDKKPLRQKATKPVAVKKNEEANEITAADSSETVATKPAPTKKRKNNSAVWMLTFLCLLLGAGSYWLWTKNKELEASQTKTNKEYVLNPAEKKLNDSLGLAPRLLNLTEPAFGKSITIGDTLFIRQDSLRINGNGIVLQRDSAYNGPAFFIAGNCKHVFLENMVLKDFSTAVINRGSGLQLKNVVFRSALMPVQQNPAITVDDTLTGTLPNIFINKKDSLQK